MIYDNRFVTKEEKIHIQFEGKKGIDADTLIELLKYIKVLCLNSKDKINDISDYNVIIEPFQE